jgi:Flp pilus assembly protein CpaB
MATGGGSAGRTMLDDGHAARRAPTNGSRPLAASRRMPNGRAAVGALLVTLAALLLFTTARRNGSSVERYVVASRPLAIGSTVAAGDLTTAAIHLPAGASRAHAFTRPAALVGAVVVAPVAAGELVQASAVVAASSTPGARQMSVPVDAARAVGGRLNPGEFVDVLATFGTGADAFTVPVVSGARVVSRSATGTGLGDSKNEVIVIEVRDAGDAIAVAHAIAAGQLSFVRVSGVAPGAPAPPYRAPRPAAS